MRSTRPHPTLLKGTLLKSALGKTALRLLALAVLLPLAGASLAQQKIEQQMSYEQFKAAGLDRLSPEQLANLNDWLDGKLKVETAKAAESAKQDSGEEDRRGLFLAASREPVDGTITSKFNGFGKGRSFTLDNGQVWQQKRGDRGMRIKVGDEVAIRRASLGSFLLTTEAAKGSMRVSRVK